MFPDLLRDDIFRLETRRLWLRWPRAADAPAIAALAGERDVAEMTAHIPHPYPPGAAEAWVLKSRAGNLGGRALTLVLTPKARPDEAIGAIGLWQVATGKAELGYWLGRPFWGRGLMSEAAGSAIAMARCVSTIETFHASARPDNPASRRVLEKCGFTRSGEALAPAPARGGALLVTIYEATRRDAEAASALKKCA